jgi:hypothetical protein
MEKAIPRPARIATNSVRNPPRPEVSDGRRQKHRSEHDPADQRHRSCSECKQFLRNSCEAVSERRELIRDLRAEERYGNNGDDRNERDQNAVFGESSSFLAPDKALDTCHFYLLKWNGDHLDRAINQTTAASRVVWPVIGDMTTNAAKRHVSNASLHAGVWDSAQDDAAKQRHSVRINRT